MLKLVVTDLDGTFLNNEGSFDKELFDETHKMMKENGVVFAACTGKQCERVEELFDGHSDIWVLGDSATRIKRDGELIKDFPLDKALGNELIRGIEAYDHRVTVIACTGESAYVSSDISEIDYRVVRDSYKELRKTDDLTAIKSDLVKITIYDKSQRSAQIKQHLLEQEYTKTVYMVASEPAWMDITAADVHKGKTVQKLQEIVGATKEETMSFGDGENDVELMSIAAYNFAMANACENTKAAASFITKTNEENSVLLTIQKMIRLMK
ncbi:hydrolase [Terribacillus saccharophilus]|uniref:HAD-IIB family hydrolase n=1 Tax=Terribacillus saccharophilus TaxID=361277 RepID=UPI000BA56F20|nr:HAD-IIB family hydrolase [Terribacillus saccharophilus]PAF35988.1 hydrolase [Terribacillus saccharophilus]